MEEELRELIELCITHEGGNPLWPDRLLPFCAKHGLAQEDFFHLFARNVAEEFVHGAMSFMDGNRAMNRLFGVADINLRGLAWDIYHAFDEGEYLHHEDPPETISWQKYTLPQVMEVLVSAGLLPRT